MEATNEVWSDTKLMLVTANVGSLFEDVSRWNFVRKPIKLYTLSFVLKHTYKYTFTYIIHTYICQCK